MAWSAEEEKHVTCETVDTIIRMHLAELELEHEDGVSASFSIERAQSQAAQNRKQPESQRRLDITCCKEWVNLVIGSSPSSDASNGNVPSILIASSPSPTGREKPQCVKHHVGMRGRGRGCRARY